MVDVDEHPFGRSAPRHQLERSSPSSRVPTSTRDRVLSPTTGPRRPTPWRTRGHFGTPRRFRVEQRCRALLDREATAVDQLVARGWRPPGNRSARRQSNRLDTRRESTDRPDLRERGVREGRGIVNDTHPAFSSGAGRPATRFAIVAAVRASQTWSSGMFRHTTTHGLRDLAFEATHEPSPAVGVYDAVTAEGREGGVFEVTLVFSSR